MKDESGIIMKDEWKTEKKVPEIPLLFITKLYKIKKIYICYNPYVMVDIKWNRYNYKNKIK